MPRRKQDCPKRMKWEGGEGGEEEGCTDTDKLDGDDASGVGSATPTSACSPVPPEDAEEPVDEQTTADPSATSVVIPEPVSPRTPILAINDVQEPEQTSAVPLNQNYVNESEQSPRCQSRESTESSSAQQRCPSRESLYSDRSATALRGVPIGPVLSPVGVALPATLPPAAAAALMPPNSAAMAAYLGAAAAAAQHSHRLMMSPLPPTFPRGAVSPLISSSSSPPGIPIIPVRPLASPTSLPLTSPIGADGGILDFSTKRPSLSKSTESIETDPNDAMNLSKPTTPSPIESQSLNSPLDLSVSSRKRGNEETGSQSQPSKKSSRQSEYKPVVSPWTSPVASHLPYFAAAVAAASNLSPKANSGHVVADPSLWNGKLKHMTPTPSDATKALEKMSELSKLGGEDLFRSMSNSATVAASNSAAGNRHSAWQSHWLNKGAEQAKDVLKCVWCKQSFPSLAAMTTHMKEAKHCGVNVPVPPMQAPTIPSTPQHTQPPISSSSSTNSSSSISSTPTSNSSKPSQADLNLLIKETMPLPRKLVRGQDVWLGKGAEQTRQILKCMWCGQSFRSLAEMTSHMQQTQHYTNIISQEQIISWKNSDEGGKGGNSGGGGGGAPGGNTGGTSSHVSAVLTCKVCDQAFSSLKELSNHMVKNSHYKEHIMRSITESGGRRRQTREKRKKSLPVRKLLELERAQHEFKNGDANGGIKPGREQPIAGRITCEKCGEKIETPQFVDHIRQCVGGGALGASQRNFLKNALMSNSILPPDTPNSMIVGHVTPASREGRKSVSDESVSPSSRHHRSPSSATDLSTKEPSIAPTEGNSSSPSVLNAIEKLIEKSFDSRVRQTAAGFVGAHGVPPTAPMGSSILKRLGIDESVDYTKPLVDPQTMNILRSYHSHQQNQHQPYGRRERSGSESSSMSERGSTRIDAMTPERNKMEPPGQPLTPRTTPDKRVQTPLPEKSHDDSAETISIKKEMPDDDDDEQQRPKSQENHRTDIPIKKEQLEEDVEDDDRGSYHSGSVISQPRMSTENRVDDVAEDGQSGVIKRSGSTGIQSPITSPRQPTPSGVDMCMPPSSPCRNSTSSPASSDRSGTPRSTAGSDKKTCGSLGALSSMFDNLSGGGSGVTASESGTSSGSRRTSSHPLAALQKLCDKTETHHGNSSRSGQSSNSHVSNQSMPATITQPSTGTTPGAILAFSWACNDAVVTSDSIMKCAFCDTPFISKGAYRHHLSKMHFVKDGVIPDPISLKPHQQSSGNGASGSGSGGGKSTPSGSTSSAPGSSVSNAAGTKSPQAPPVGFEESPHSKFLKYTELAKQLSSKYV